LTGVVYRVAKWWPSSLNFRSQKCVLIENAERPPQTKFQLLNMFGSWKIKSPRIAYHLYRSYFLNEISHSPIQMIGDYWGFYFSRTKHVLKLKFGLWGSFAIFNQYKFLWLKIQTEKSPFGNLDTPHQSKRPIRVVVRLLFEVFGR
jgi:hypothetical protein